MEQARCAWAKGELDRIYHDTEWGRPAHGERELFERLILEGMQAGLSWSIILKKREAMREAFAGFEPQRLARFGEPEISALMQNAGIIRNRRKIEAAIQNARRYEALCNAHGSLDAFLWRYVEGTPILNRFATLEEIPAETELSRQMSKDLRKLGFSFVGPTILYALMQSIGMVNDHVTSCFCHPEYRQNSDRRE